MVPAQNARLNDVCCSRNENQTLTEKEARPRWPVSHSDCSMKEPSNTEQSKVTGHAATLHDYQLVHVVKAPSIH